MGITEHYAIEIELPAPGQEQLETADSEPVFAALREHYGVRMVWGINLSACYPLFH
jgi:hypothetical protein